MSSTRNEVLKTLLKQQKCTINELADAVGINPISVRHHVDKLLAEGLIAAEDERHGVGRPRRVYFLTDKGMEQFPTRYLQLTIRLLKQLKETLPPNMVDKLFNQMATELLSEYANEIQLDDLSIEERLSIVADLLSAEGFTVELEQSKNQYLIHEVNCPYYHVGQNHPEVCSVDQSLISTVLSVPVEKIQCILNGDAHCTYVVDADLIQNNQENKP